MKKTIIAIICSIPFIASAQLTVTIDGRVFHGKSVTIVPDKDTPEPPPPPPPPGDCPEFGGHLIVQDAQSRGLKTYNFTRGQAYALKVPRTHNGLLAYGASTDKGNGYTFKLVTLSQCPGDFKQENFIPGCVAYGVEGGIYYAYGGTQSRTRCALEEGKDYYFNIRNYDYRRKEDSCPVGQLCGFSLNINRP